MSLKKRLVAVIGLAATLPLAGCNTAGADGREVIERSTLGAAMPPVIDGDGWQLVWSDEFEGEQIDRSKWDFDVNCWGGGNNERQCYTDRPENAAVKDGTLVITARKEEFRGPALPPHMQQTDEDAKSQKVQPFTSARLVTRGKASWRYGRIEVRAKLPQGQGTWPAIWMLPDDDEYGTWAASGEIDIMEAVNLGVQCEKCPGGLENEIAGTLHFGGSWPDNALHSTRLYFPEVLEGFHTYGVIWEPERMIWTVDGRVYAEKATKDWYTTNSDAPRAPFDKRFHLIVNFAVGGKWPEEEGVLGLDRTGFPKTFEVDWVRVWQCGAADSQAENGADAGAAKCTDGAAN